MNQYCPKCNSEFILDEVLDYERNHPYNTITISRYCECCGETTTMKLTYKFWEQEVLENESC